LRYLLAAPPRVYFICNTMSPKVDRELEAMQVEIPDALALRIEAFCEKNEIPVQEFIFDAIVEKLKRSNEEKRKRPRM
jgi:hypothetical protein